MNTPAKLINVLNHEYCLSTILQWSRDIAMQLRSQTVDAYCHIRALKLLKLMFFKTAEGCHNYVAEQ